MKSRGYVTTLEWVAGRNGRELERTLGFGAGSLDQGFSVYRLDMPIELNEFQWKDQTLYADGWRYDPDCNEMIPVEAELRAEFGKRNDYDEGRTDARLARFDRLQRMLLNHRDGPRQIVKVVSNVKPKSYPPAEVRRVPQWALLVDKSFRFVVAVAPGGTCPPLGDRVWSQKGGSAV